jgi:BirA family biotin operon repressor/biotin-[acetyl-CoA-carboxylase] ligase
MISRRNSISSEKIKDKLRTELVGREIYHFTKVSSTNDVARELAINGAKEGTVVIAETQSRGRGRLSRIWVSPRGGIWFSVILRPKINPKDAHKITFMIALAVTKTIMRLFKLETKIKWPNDVLVNNKKVCGILTELSSTSGDSVDFVVAGVGVNANVNVKSFSEDFREFATSLNEQMKKEISRETFLQVLLEEIECYYKTLTRNSFNKILEEWKSLTITLNAYVEATSFNRKVEGRAIDVDLDGALLIELNDGSITKIVSGDVHLLV